MEDLPVFRSRNPICEKRADANKDAMYFGDYHSSGAGDNLFWLSLTRDEYLNMDIEISARYFIEKMSREFIKSYDLSTTEEHLGYISHMNVPGSAKMYASSLGIPSCTFETFNKFLHESSNFSEATVKASTESITNWLLVLLKQFRHSYHLG